MNGNIANIEKVIDYIENNLSNKLDLDKISEAAKLLFFSDRPIIEIAFICGYESQQAFFWHLSRCIKFCLHSIGKIMSSTHYS